MKKLVYLLSQMNNKKGQGMVEYGLIIGLIAVVIIGALVAMSGSLDGIFDQITTKLGGTPS